MYRVGCKVYSSFNILWSYIYWYLSFVIYDLKHSIKYQESFLSGRRGKGRRPASLDWRRKKWDSFEWENKTMKISGHSADASIVVLWPILAWEQLNPSLTNKSRFSSKPGEDFIKETLSVLRILSASRYCIFSFPDRISN